MTRAFMLLGKRVLPSLAMITIFGCWREPTPAQWRGVQQLRKRGQLDIVAHYPLDVQIDLLVYGVGEVHPPDTFLSPYIAEQGEPAALALVQRIQKERDANIRVWLMEVIWLMSLMHAKSPQTAPYSPAEDAALMTRLKVTIQSIEEGEARNDALNLLEMINNPLGRDSGGAEQNPGY